MTNKQDPNVLIGKEVITIALPRKLSERQRFLVKAMGKDFDLEAIRSFLRSFEGNRSSRYNGFNKYTDKLKASGTDELAIKREGSILELYKEKRDLLSYKLSPSKAIPEGKAIGIEIECFVPCSMEELREAFLKTSITNVRAADDGSIRAEEGYEPVEFRVLSNVDDLSNLKDLCAFLSEIGARVNRSCGLHVHLDARAYASCPASIVNRLRTALPLLSAMVPASRISNEFCSRDVSTRGHRYAKINRESFSKHKTIEVRLHSGTCDFTKISSWIAILHSIAFSKKRIQTCDVMTYASKLSWPPSLVSYVIERARKFNPSFIGESQAPSSTSRDEENREIPEEAEEFSCCDCGCEISESQSDNIGRCDSCDEEECERYLEEERREDEREAARLAERQRLAAIESERLERERLAGIERDATLLSLSEEERTRLIREASQTNDSDAA